MSTDLNPDEVQQHIDFLNLVVRAALLELATRWDNFTLEATKELFAHAPQIKGEDIVQLTGLIEHGILSVRTSDKSEIYDPDFVGGGLTIYAINMRGMNPETGEQAHLLRMEIHPIPTEYANLMEPLAIVMRDAAMALLIENKLIKDQPPIDALEKKGSLH